jgi:Tol biopolymer transport system component
LKSGERKTVREGGSDAHYVPSGHIVYMVGSNLMAVPFDLRSLTVTGGPVPVIEGVLRAASQATAAASFAFSDNGSMVYVPGMGADAGLGRILALVDRNGARKPISVPPLPYFQPRISPDGKQLVVGTDDGKEAAVWVYDLSGATSMRKLTFGGANKFPLWSQDGQRVVFLSEKDGDTSLFWQRADGSGSAELLTKLEQKQSTEYSPDSWSMDGKTLIFSSLGGDTSIWSLATERDAKPKVLIDVPSRRDQDANISPDGRWMVYDSGGVTGQPQIYVQPFPPTGAKYQITTTLGIFPIWSPDGKQIFFLQNTAGVARIFSVDVQTQPSFVFGKPAPLPIEGILSNGRQGGPRGYDITPDGKQFLVMLPPSETEAGGIRQAQQINVTLNWFEELKQRAAAK